MYIVHINKYMLKWYKLILSSIWDAKIKLIIFSLKYAAPSMLNKA